MDREQLEKVKERIAKLLAMSKDVSSPNEAAIAAQRARALMDKYQLDEFDISAAKADDFACDPATRAFAAVPYHLGTLAVAVAKYNDCQTLYDWASMDYKMASKAQQNAKTGGGFTKKVGKRIVFRGFKSDVELAIQMFNYLSDTIDALCKKYMQANHPGKYSVRIGGEYKNAAAQAIIRSIEAMLVERQQLTSSAGTSLVVVKSAAVSEKFGVVKYVNSSKGHAKGLDWEEKANNENARRQGYIDGSKVEITKRLDD